MANSTPRAVDMQVGNLMRAQRLALDRQHRRGGEAAAGSANAAEPAHITDRDRAVQGAGL